jgi:hypothetical protein
MPCSCFCVNAPSVTRQRFSAGDEMRNSWLVFLYLSPPTMYCVGSMSTPSLSYIDEP